MWPESLSLAGLLRSRVRRPATLLAAVLAMAWGTTGPTMASEPALPRAVYSSGLTLKPVGGDELSLYGFRVYHASLWTPTGRYEPGQPAAFNLLYRRGFTKERLVEITLTTWNKLGVGTDAQRKAWAQSLRHIWRDVGKGDMLAAVVVPGLETRFYNSAGLLGRVEDKEFGPAYLGIWLDEKTLLPDLRASLLGTKGKS
jgi:hypothetical protein